MLPHDLPISCIVSYFIFSSPAPLTVGTGHDVSSYPVKYSGFKISSRAAPPPQRPRRGPRRRACRSRAVFSGARCARTRRSPAARGWAAAARSRAAPLRLNFISPTWGLFVLSAQTGAVQKLGVLPMRAKPSVPRVTRKRVIRSTSCAGIVTCRTLLFVEYLSSVFRRKHYVIFAIPLRMR